MLTLPILAYLAVLWAVKGRDTTHALAANWAVNQAAVILNDGQSNLLVFLLVDFLTALWLALRLQTKIARQTAAFFIPMIAWNAGAYAAASPLPEWHHTILFGLAWLQLLWVVIGVKGDELVDYLDHTSGSLRNSIFGAFTFWRGDK